MILDQHPGHEFRILLFGDEIPGRELRIRNIDRDDLFSRRVLIGHQVKERPVVSDA
jgi:hypothetical protein